MPNQTTVLTSSTVRQWVASLKVEEFLLGKKKQESPRSVDHAQESASKPAASESGSLYASSTGEDFEEFLKYMKQGKRPFRKPGISVKQEYELWLHARSKSRSTAA